MAFSVYSAMAGGLVNEVGTQCCCCGRDCPFKTHREQSIFKLFLQIWANWDLFNFNFVQTDMCENDSTLTPNKVSSFHVGTSPVVSNTFSGLFGVKTYSLIQFHLRQVLLACVASTMLLGTRVAFPRAWRVSSCSIITFNHN